ncbi:hypothetical protein [Clostridium weizhouense]|uniref:Uncharacterized protein n=1 Tax=Clostridium weizhouense TaxID=2859781 RepID=A0ABS7AP18_9CLOT|nr:hypothetical protein [Clostridium weizhouense]MBW6409426.1 hypothetical protein [Clostridium weizhouense]
MKNFKKYILFILIIILAIFLLYYFHPKNTTLGNIFSVHCDKENINKLYIRGINSRTENYIEDKNQIESILSNLSNVELIEYSGDTSKNRTKGSYEICIYESGKNNLYIYTLGKEYLIIYNDSDFYKTYKVLNNSFNRKYMEKITSE